MHTDQQIQDIGLLNKGLQLLNIDVSLKPDAKRTHPVACRFINNPDGSLRYIWPASSNTPQILRFNYEGSKKQKLFAKLMRIGFAMRVPGLVSSGKKVLYTSTAGIRQLGIMADWAIYTGKPGNNRKLLIWHEDKEGRSAFTKLSLSIQAAKNIYKERMALLEPRPASVIAPEHINTRCLAFTQEDVLAQKGLRQINTMSDIPQTALQEWLGYGVHQRTLGEVKWYREALEWLEAPAWAKDNRVSQILREKMRTLMDCMLPKASVPVANAHCNFLPCNMRRNGDNLLLIDWGLSRAEMPALYDLFHFVYQTSILEHKASFTTIRQQIDELLRQPEWESFLLEHDIDPGEAEQQYLLSTISYHLKLYAQQECWSTRVAPMMQAWCEALGFWMDYEGLLTQRQLVLQDVVHFLHDRPYAAMKLVEEDITELPLTSVLDLCMPTSTASALVNYLRSHRCIENIREKAQSYKRQLSLYLSSGSIIHIDCISEMRSRRLVYANATQILQESEFNTMGIRVPDIQDDSRYTRLSYLLDREVMPMHYRNHYRAQSINTWFSVSSQLQQTSGDKNSIPDPFMQDEGYRNSFIHFLKTLPENSGLRGLLRTVQHIGDVIRDVIPRRGCIITFSGVDGAGKSTVIEATRTRVAKELRMPVVVLHRPSLLPILSVVKYNRTGEERPSIAKAQPRQTPGRSLLAAYLRFALFYTDYLIGQCYVQLRYVMRGYVVLYDRYFFDFINESQGSNVVLPASITSWWYRFLLKPDLNFLLYAPAEVIRQRKQELSSEDIEQLTGKYLALFRKLEQHSTHSHYISLRNLRLGDTVETLFQHIKSSQSGKAA